MSNLFDFFNAWDEAPVKVESVRPAFSRFRSDFDDDEIDDEQFYNSRFHPSVQFSITDKAGKLVPFCDVILTDFRSYSEFVEFVWQFTADYGTPFVTSCAFCDPEDGLEVLYSKASFYKILENWKSAAG